MKKRLLSALLTLCMVLTMLPWTAQAEEDYSFPATDGKNYCGTSENSTTEVTSDDNGIDLHTDIPSSASTLDGISKSLDDSNGSTAINPGTEILLAAENNYEAVIPLTESLDDEISLFSAGSSLHVWISDEYRPDALGRNVPSTVRLGDTTYLCYEILRGSGPFKYDGTDPLY